MSSTRKMPRSLNWVKKLLPGAVDAAAVGVAAAAGALVADAAGEAAAVAAAAAVVMSPGVRPEGGATPVRRVNGLTALMKASVEGRVLLGPAVFTRCSFLPVAA
jgi:hypothetical protein